MTKSWALERHLILWSCVSVLLWDPKVLTNFGVGCCIVNASAFEYGALPLSCSICNSGAEGNAGLTAHSRLFGQSGTRPHSFRRLERARCLFGESGQSKCGNERENKTSLTRWWRWAGQREVTPYLTVQCGFCAVASEKLAGLVVPFLPCFQFMR